MVRVGLGNEGAVGSVLADIQGRLGEPCRMNHGNLQSLPSMETAVLSGNNPGEGETSEVLLETAERAFALMATACNAVKERRWNEVEEMLRSVQNLVQQLRIGVRDERLPINPPDMRKPERQDNSRNEGSC